MLFEGFSRVRDAPGPVLWPAAAIAVTTIAFTLVGESFRRHASATRPRRSSSSESRERAQLLSVRGLGVALPGRRRRPPGAARRVVRHRPRRDPRARRRVGIRQVDRRRRDPQDPRPQRPDHERLDRVRRARPDGAAVRRDAQGPRRRDRHDLPGPARLAQPDDAGRAPVAARRRAAIPESPSATPGGREPDHRPVRRGRASPIPSSGSTTTPISSRAACASGS